MVIRCSRCNTKVSDGKKTSGLNWVCHSCYQKEIRAEEEAKRQEKKKSKEALQKKRERDPAYVKRKASRAYDWRKW